MDDESDYDYSESMSKIERMLFYALIHRYNRYDDDDCEWWISGVFLR